MIRLQMKNCNMILTEAAKISEKVINTNIFQVKKCYLQIKAE